MSSYEEILKAAKEMHRRGAALADRKHVKSGEAEQVSAALFISLLEQARALIVLFEQDCALHAPLFLRSMLEGLARLKVLAVDPGYVREMEFVDSKSAYGISLALSGEVSGLLPGLSEELEKIKERHKFVVDKAKESGLKRETVEGLLRRPGMEDHYAFYSFCSGFSHHQLGILRGRTQHEGLIIGGSSLPVETKCSFLQGAVALLGAAIECLPNFLSVDADKVSEYLRTPYDRDPEVIRS